MNLLFLLIDRNHTAQMNIQLPKDISFFFLHGIKKERRYVKNILYTFLYNLHLDYSANNLNKHIQPKLYPTLKEKSKLFSHISTLRQKIISANKDMEEFS